MLKTFEKDYKGAERKELKRLLLSVIDMKNVVTVYRYTLFGAGTADAKKTLIPFKRRLSDDAIERLAAGNARDGRNTYGQDKS